MLFRSFKKVASGTQKKVILLGDMLELGADTEKEHRNILSKLIELNPEHCILVGPYFKAVADAAPPGSIFLENSTQAATYLNTLHLSEAVILIKGSRGSKMELVLEGLQKS